MNVTIEAIYEAGVFKPLSPVENIREHERVRLIIETESLVDDAQRKNRIKIDPDVAREIGESPEFEILNARRKALDELTAQAQELAMGYE